jgi:ABC-type dipeptide/oligopeptide/nickel transport system permease subunit
LTDARRWACQHPAFIVGLAIIGLLVVVSLLAPVLAPYDPTEIHARDGLKPPSATYLLGTDNLGRDIFSRILYAARTSLLVALGSVLVASAIGVPLGLVAGFAGGKVDSVIMRVLDAILAFPVILLAILVVATLGTETINLVLTIGFVFIPYFTRLVRGNVLALKEREFVEASRASGASDPYLVTRVILPNILSPVVVQASLTMSLAVLIEAALSFLGLGVQDPTPAWGSMLQNSQLYLQQAPWFALSPGACIFLSVLAFNLAGDGLRDLLDVTAHRR